MPLFFPSSTSVYLSDEPSNFESPIKTVPKNSYAKVKKMEEEYLINLSSEGLHFKIMRFGTITGVSPGMRFHTAVNSFCLSHALGRPIKVWGNSLLTKRPYLSLNDASKAISFFLDKKLGEKIILDVVTSNLDLKTIFNFIEKKSNKEVKYVFDKNDKIGRAHV